MLEGVIYRDKKEKRGASVGSMLAQWLRRCPNIKPIKSLD